MKKEEKLQKIPSAPRARVLEGQDLTPGVGEWYWVDDGKGKWLGCVTKVGSNFAEVTNIHDRTKRYAFADLYSRSEPEHDADSVIDAKVQEWQSEARRLMGEVEALTASLCLTSSQRHQDQPETQALSVVGGGQNLAAYKGSLIEAKKVTLPGLFSDIKDANESMARWMVAKTIPLKAMTGDLSKTIKQIDARIFNVELYAGLTERVVQFATGAPAPANQRLHVFQRRHYMDEECLLAYKAGGMEFADIHAFNAWLAEPENRDRILPFPRCLVAFKVRRERKERDWERASIQDFITFEALDRANELTFLYIRNGDNLYVLQSQMDFGEKVIPDRDWSLLTEELMFCEGSVIYKEPITRKEYEARMEKAQAEKKIEDEEREEKRRQGLRPRIGGHWDILDRRWVPYTPESIYYDEMRRYVSDKVTEYNRIAILIQGLFDRSPILHPHPQVKTWDPASFAAAVRMVFDDEHVLTPGPTPDFEAYKERLNSLLKPGDACIGQEDIWLRREAKKENDRIDRGWRRNEHPYTRFRPYGDPGPGYIAVPAKLTKTYATFRWLRERKVYDPYNDDLLPTAIRVKRKALFNVSGYKPGDFKQFYADPRTRADYVKWAPFLLAAEDWHAAQEKSNE